MNYPVLAFLQNCWFPQGTAETIIAQYLADHEYRRKVLANTMTGKRLVTAFGHRYYEIWWDNASPKRGMFSGHWFDPDVEHMHKVIDTVKPNGIIAFGRHAHEGMDWRRQRYPTNSRNSWHTFPHPNKRGVHQADLNAFAEEIISRYF